MHERFQNRAITSGSLIRKIEQHDLPQNVDLVRDGQAVAVYTLAVAVAHFFTHYKCELQNL